MMYTVRQGVREEVRRQQLILEENGKNLYSRDAYIYKTFIGIIIYQRKTKVKWTDCNYTLLMYHGTSVFW